MYEKNFTDFFGFNKLFFGGCSSVSVTVTGKDFTDLYDGDLSSTVSDGNALPDYLSGSVSDGDYHPGETLFQDIPSSAYDSGIVQINQTLILILGFLVFWWAEKKVSLLVDKFTSNKRRR